MIVNKIGFEHIFQGTNCQDSGVEFKNIKCVVDGCSGSTDSEVGAKLFCHLLTEMYTEKMDINDLVKLIFDKLLMTFTNDDSIDKYLLFTILILVEEENEFILYESGDGVVLKTDIENNIQYEIIEYNNYPPYFAYNYMNKENMKQYKEQLELKKHIYSKSIYNNIGIASDGLNYLINSNQKLFFEKCIQIKNKNKINLLINRCTNYHLNKQFLNNSNVDLSNPLPNLKDDITIVY